MNVSFFKKYGTYIVIGLLLLVIVFQNGCNKDKISDLESRIGMMSVENQTLKREVNKLGDSVLKQTAIVVSNQKQLDKYADSVFRLKKEKTKTLAYLQTRTRTQIKEVLVPYRDTITQERIVYIDSLGNQHMKVPREFEVADPDYVIQGVVKAEGVLIEDLSVPDTLSARIVEKGGLFRKHTIEFQIKNTNKHVHMEGMNSIMYQPKKKTFFKRVVVPVLVGVFIGAVGHNMTQ